MKMQSQVVCTAIESAKGEMEGTPYDSTKFHLQVDLGKKSNGKTMGCVSRPYKFGDSTEIEKWAHLDAHFASGKSVLCDCQFDVVAGSGNESKLVLLAIQPAAQAPQSKAAQAAS